MTWLETSIQEALTKNYNNYLDLDAVRENFFEKAYSIYLNLCKYIKET